MPIVRKQEGSSERTLYKDIQTMDVGNIGILKELAERCKRYDIFDILCIPDYCNKNAQHPTNKWHGTDKRTCLLENWSSVSFPRVADYQSDLNKFLSVDGVSSE